MKGWMADVAGGEEEEKEEGGEEEDEGRGEPSSYCMCFQKR